METPISYTVFENRICSTHTSRSKKSQYFPTIECFVPRKSLLRKKSLSPATRDNPSLQCRCSLLPVLKLSVIVTARYALTKSTSNSLIKICAAILAPGCAALRYCRYLAIDEKHRPHIVLSSTESLNLVTWSASLNRMEGHGGKDLAYTRLLIRLILTMGSGGGAFYQSLCDVPGRDLEVLSRELYVAQSSILRFH